MGKNGINSEKKLNYEMKLELFHGLLICSVNFFLFIYFCKKFGEFLKNIVQLQKIATLGIKIIFLTAGHIGSLCKESPKWANQIGSFQLR